MDPMYAPRPAQVLAALTDAELRGETKALGEQVKQRNRMTAADLLKMGANMIELKARVKGRGESWLEHVTKYLPEYSIRSVQYWMRQTKCATVAHLETDLQRATHPAGDTDVLTPEELAEIEDWDPADPTPDRGDAHEGEDEEEKPRKPGGKDKERPKGGKPAVQQEIDMEPELTAARQAVAECKDTADAFAERVKQVLESKAGAELRKQFRLSGVTVADDGTLPTFESVRRLVEKVATQGFPA